MVLEKIGFVDVEEAAVGAGKKARLERLFAGGERPLEIESARDPILRRAERQIDDGNRPKEAFERAARLGAAGRAQAGRRRRFAMVGTADDRAHFGQEGG